MNKFLDGGGVAHLWETVKSLVAESVASVNWSSIRNKPDLALKSDLSSVYRFKGSVADYASLPAAENGVGDVWNVEATGMNYAWTGDAWDALGAFFEIQSITDEEIDAITQAEEE